VILGGVAELKNDNVYTIYFHDTMQKIPEQQTAALLPSSSLQMAVVDLLSNSLAQETMQY